MKKKSNSKIRDLLPSARAQHVFRRLRSSPNRNILCGSTNWDKITVRSTTCAYAMTTFSIAFSFDVCVYDCARARAFASSQWHSILCVCFFSPSAADATLPVPYCGWLSQQCHCFLYRLPTFTLKSQPSIIYLPLVLSRSRKKNGILIVNRFASSAVYWFYRCCA